MDARRLGFAFSPQFPGQNCATSTNNEEGRLQSMSGSSDLEPSSSEQSADTVIYVGPADEAATDGEHPPVYLPSLADGDQRGAMGRALRGSSAEHRPGGKFINLNFRSSRATKQTVLWNLTIGMCPLRSSDCRCKNCGLAVNWLVFQSYSQSCFFFSIIAFW